ncbi:unnamed protein product [Prorocentrum cordatum]|uniref:Uncharacterized protein n=1 Tax=Prorocentrum cordatum TaxID=2364126 RepID=A0ABN9TUP1_9DINO|nr:unnamed protein product [Polarella glacialis]
MPGAPMTAEEIRLAQEWHTNGDMAPSDIAANLQRDKSSITRLIKDNFLKKTTGRKNVLSEAQVANLISHLERVIKKANGEYEVTWHMLKTSSRCKASEATIARGLHENRFEQFTADGVPLTKAQLRTVPPCRENWCKWLVATATAFASGAPAAPPQPPPQLRPAGGGAAAVEVEGFLALTRRVSIPDDLANTLHDGALAVGAASVSELTADDWAALPSWARLLPLQQRRVLSASAAPPLPQLRC